MPPTRLLIVGAGYTGLEIARQANHLGFELHTTTSNPQRQRDLQDLGATVLEWDALGDPSALLPHIDADTALIYSVPPLFKEHQPATSPEPARHVAPVLNLLQAAKDQGCTRFVYLSSTSVYGDYQGAWIDEAADLHPNRDQGKMRRDIEEALLKAPGVTTSTLRIVGIYGPGRTILTRLKSGRYALVDGGKKITNRIHVEDLAQAALAAATRHTHNSRAYNVSDGEPFAVHELVSFVCEATGLPMPESISLEDYALTASPLAVGFWTHSARVDNTRLTEELGVKLRYPNVFAGYRPLLEAFNQAPDLP
ncbi:hypothetical protein DL240_11300 [Lujinxingia litoralis]|uniref:NAD-dependent epimerase/dehydratase domain-containing protein n=1 Tax=Lujinxingia litoralis TaxID=2211119 RepID=A0A328C925_9DELT|nr:NAD-dependent epimerase/dehydratase family protein [Lujinxingia litoralis]RAL22425.1 hypothetical protein DL240_11300 [Lujinxingia litoralis]